MSSPAATLTAFVPSDRADARIELAEVPEPVATADQAVVAVEAFSVNRGETFLLEAPREGWRPGQDVAGRVLDAAANGSGPPVGARVVGHASGGGWALRVPISTDALVELTDAIVAPVAATDLVASGRLHPEIGLLADWRETPDELVAGRMELRDPLCRPTCPEAKIFRYPARVSLSRPRTCRSETGEKRRYFSRVAVRVKWSAGNPFRQRAGWRTRRFRIPRDGSCELAP